MIAVDTNILVYAHRVDAPFHAVAVRCVTTLAEGRAAWAIPWPCVHEFLGSVTRQRVLDPPTPLDAALAQVEAWLASPSLVLLAEGPGYWSELRAFLAAGQVVGPPGSRCADRNAVPCSRGAGALDCRSRLESLRSPRRAKSAGRRRGSRTRTPLRAASRARACMTPCLSA
jgi:uncharacterized protein